MKKKIAALLMTLLMAGTLFAPTTLFAQDTAVEEEAVQLVSNPSLNVFEDAIVTNGRTEKSTFILSTKDKSMNVTPVYASGKKVPYQNFTFKSSKSGVVAVDAKGNVRPKKFGKAVITVTYVGSAPLHPSSPSKFVYTILSSPRPAREMYKVVKEGTQKVRRYYQFYMKGKVVHSHQGCTPGTTAPRTASVLDKPGVRLCRQCYG